MARIRSVHPEICVDEVLAGVSPRAERTFVRLWTYLDDQGRGKGDLRLIKAALYPLDDRVDPSVIEEDLAELAEAELLLRYDGPDGRAYVAAKPEAWARWQRPQRPRLSDLPAPPGAMSTLSAMSTRCVNGVARTHPPDDVPVVVVGEGETNTLMPGGMRGACAPEPFAAEFDACWAIYPRRTERKRALRAYQARRRAGASAEDLLVATRHYAEAMAGAESRFVKHGSTFYGRDDPWQDWVHPAPEAKAEPRW